MDKNTEEIIVNTFFIPQKRERALYELFSAKKRREFIWKLSQNIIVEQKAERITVSIASYADVKKLLLKWGATTECYVLSINSGIDGTLLSLDDALYNVVGAGPALISCIHGRLAYLECEQSYGAPARFILYDGCKLNREINFENIALLNAPTPVNNSNTFCSAGSAACLMGRCPMPCKGSALDLPRGLSPFREWRYPHWIPRLRLMFP